MPLNARELSQRLKKLSKALKGFSRNPTIEEVHDLRTRAFRVENILEALGMDSSGNEKKLLARLSTVRRRAGKVRDLDIFTSDVVGLGAGDEPECMVRLVHHFGFERHRHAEKLHRAVQAYATELRRRLKLSQRKMKAHLKRYLAKKADLDSAKKGKAEDSPLHATSVALRLLKELRSVPRLGPDNLHSFRIEVKRLRYVLEMAGEQQPQQKSFITELKRVQDAIGEWHDWLELAAIARDILQHDKGCKLQRKLEETTQSKFKEALRLAEDMRRRFLAAPERSSKALNRRQKKPQNGLPPSVITATSEILA